MKTKNYFMYFVLRLCYMLLVINTSLHLSDLLSYFLFVCFVGFSFLLNFLLENEMTKKLSGKNKLKPKDVIIYEESVPKAWIGKSIEQIAHEVFDYPKTVLDGKNETHK